MSAPIKTLPEPPPDDPGPRRNHNDVYLRDGVLWRWVVKKGKGTDEQITDCEVWVICAHESEGEHQWEVLLQRKGFPSIRQMLPSDIMEHPGKWNAWASAAGVFCWNLNHDSRWALKRYLLRQPNARRIIHRASVSGVVSEFGVTIARGSCIGYDGTVVDADDKGMFKLRCKDGQDREFYLPAVEGAHVPIFDNAFANITQARAKARIYIDCLHAYLSHHGGAMAYGWVVASVLARDDLMQARDQFPHLYITGRYQSGKNVLSKSLYGAIGMAHVAGIDATSTPKGIRNRLSETGHFPLWVNEMDFKEGPMKLMAQIRAAFDNQGMEVARMEGGIKTFPVRRGLLLSGQHVVGADAEMSRYVIIRLSLAKRDDTKIAQLHDAQPQATAAMATMLANRTVLAGALVKFANQYRKILSSVQIEKVEGAMRRRHTIDDRQAWCWAVALAGLRVAWSGAEENLNPKDALPEGALQEALTRATEALDVSHQEGAIGQFWSAVEAMDAAGKLANTGRSAWVRYFPHKDKDGVIHPSVAVAMAMLYKQLLSGGYGKQLPEKLDSIITEFREEDGFIVHNANVQFSSGIYSRTRRATLFYAKSACIPVWVRDLLDENAKNAERDKTTAAPPRALGDHDD